MTHRRHRHPDADAGLRDRAANASGNAFVVPASRTGATIARGRDGSRSSTRCARSWRRSRTPTGVGLPAAGDRRPRPDRGLRGADPGPARRGPFALQDGHRRVHGDAAASRGSNVFGGYPPACRSYANVDREKVKQARHPARRTCGFDTLQACPRPAYVNDFTRFGRTFQVNVQADAFRASKDDIERLGARSPTGKMVPLGALKVEERPDRRASALQPLPPAMVTGEPASGSSSGQALAVVEDLAHRVLPSGMSIAWAAPRSGEARGQAGLVAPSFSGLVVVPDPRGAVRELGDTAVGGAVGAAHGAERARRRRAALRQQCSADRMCC